MGRKKEKERKEEKEKNGEKEGQEEEREKGGGGERSKFIHNTCGFNSTRYKIPITPCPAMGGWHHSRCSPSTTQGEGDAQAPPWRCPGFQKETLSTLRVLAAAP